MSDTPTQTPESILAEIFGVQVPLSVSKVVQQRLFTLAARDNADKVIGHPEVCALLEHIGAIVPERPSKADYLNCFGVLWCKDHVVCRNCAVQLTCRAIAASYGLDTIKISPRLLGAKITRFSRPARSFEPAGTSPGNEASVSYYQVYPSTERDLELLEWLNTTMCPTLRNNEIHYYIPDTNYYPISVGKPDGLMEVRFCAPSAEIKRLLKQKKSIAGPPVWIIPATATFDEAVSMINAHVEALFENL